MSKPLSEAVAERLRVEMAIKPMRPAELARHLGVSHTYISRRVSGDVVMDLRDVERIAHALGISPARLLAPVSAALAVA